MQRDMHDVEKVAGATEMRGDGCGKIEQKTRGKINKSMRSGAVGASADHHYSPGGAGCG